MSVNFRTLLASYELPQATAMLWTSSRLEAGQARAADTKTPSTFNHYFTNADAVDRMQQPGPIATAQRQMLFDERDR